MTLRERFREDRLGLTASSLTFTTTMALVPFFTVALAVFTAFPMFGKLQEALQGWLVQSLIPDAIARQVLGYLNQFAGKASRLGAAGFVALFVTALALVLTIDRTLNGIWRVRRPRPLGQRVLVYWAVMTLGPLLLGASLSMSSYVLSASRGLVGIDAGRRAGAAEPHRVRAAGRRPGRAVPVRAEHAGAAQPCMGRGAVRCPGHRDRRAGCWRSTSARCRPIRSCTAPSPRLPILLVWIYVAWIIVLLGAVIAAYLPSLIAGTRRRATAHGWQFQLALEVLQHLHRARTLPRRGLSGEALAQALEVDALQLEPVLEALVSLDWIGRINELEDDAATRYILLAEPQTTVLEPLMRQLLLPQSDATAKLWQSGQLSAMRLSDVI